MDPADRLEIHELMARYGHIVDARAWDRAGELFTADARYDMRDFDMGVATGPTEIAAMWADPDAPHPLAHHATNVVIDHDDDGTVRVRSKGIGVGRGGRVGSVTYDDVVVRTPDGWRMADRRATLRR